MGTNYYLVKNKPSIDGGLHIGKSSIGWEFIFYKPPFWECNREINTFEDWMDYLKEKTEVGAYVILDEYENIIPYDEFIKIVEEKQKANNPDTFKLYENVNGYAFFSENFS